MDENQKTEQNTEVSLESNSEIPSISLNADKVVDEIPSISLEGTFNRKEEKPVKPKKKGSSNVVWIIMLVAIVFIGGVLFTTLFPKREEKSVTIDESKVIQDYGKLLESKIKASKEKMEYEQVIQGVSYEYNVVCLEHEIHEDGTVYLNQCSINGKSVKSYYGRRAKKEEKAAGALLVYVSKDSHKATLSVPSDLSKYDTYDFDIDEKYSNLELLCDTCDYVIYLNNENEGRMMNYKTGEMALSGVEYGSILPIQYNNSYDSEYVVVQKKIEESSLGREKYTEKVWSVYNLKKGTKSVPQNFNEFFGRERAVVKIHFYAEAIDEGLLFIREGSNYGIIDYRTGKEIIPFKPRDIRKYDSYYVMTENNRVVIMDRYGKHYLDNYNLLAFASVNYIFSYDESHHVRLIDINGQEVFDFGEWKIYKLYSRVLSTENRVALQFNASESDYRSCIQFEYLPKEKKGFAANTECNSNLPKLGSN